MVTQSPPKVNAKHTASEVARHLSIMDRLLELKLDGSDRTELIRLMDEYVRDTSDQEADDDE